MTLALHALQVRHSVRSLAAHFPDVCRAAHSADGRAPRRRCRRRHRAAVEKRVVVVEGAQTVERSSICEPCYIPNNE
eukprot:4056210-Pyramimonas_sp.AAC.1